MSDPDNDRLQPDDNADPDIAPLQPDDNADSDIAPLQPDDKAGVRGCLRQHWQKFTPLALLAVIILLNVIILCISGVLLKATATVTCSCEETQQQSAGFTGGNDGSYIMSAFSNLSGLIKQNHQITSNLSDFVQQNGQMISNIVATLANHGSVGISTAGAVDDVYLVVQKILQIQNVSSVLNSATPVSCKAIKEVLPNSSTGYYYVNGRNIYCNMEELCGSGGGWTRLAYLDMTDATMNCPSGFRLYQSGGVRVCGRAASNGGSCTSVQFPSNGISYSQVCGRVTGYQFGSTDADYYDHNDIPNHSDINSYYVDGVSITRGSPRQHVWTLMAGLMEASYDIGTNDARYNCPCSQGSPQNLTLQSFIGNDYFCESGNPATDGRWQLILYTSDPLWDDKGCGSLEGNCCTSRPSLPWFNKALGTTTTDYLEMRICGDQEASDEDAPVSFYELYVK